jgi:hypothetical protein
MGACLSDVEYLRAGDKGASGSGGNNSQGGTYAGSFGNAGTFHVGGMEEGGKGNTGNDAGAAGDPVEMGGNAGMMMGGNAGTGGAAVTGCNNPRIIELFDFLDPKYVENTSLGTVLEKWVKGPYDSTDTATGKADATASPPSNAKNLANMSILDVAQNDGDPPGSMRYTIPFSPVAPFPQHVHILYIFAAHGDGAKAVDVSRATMKANVTLKSAPNDNCTVTVNMWTTGTVTGNEYNHVDGPAVIVSAGKWASVQMNLATSDPPTSINQYGFAIHSSCTKIDMSAGGAGGAPEIPMGPTILEIDNIITKCM